MPRIPTPKRGVRTAFKCPLRSLRAHLTGHRMILVCECDYRLRKSNSKSIIQGHKCERKKRGSTEPRKEKQPEGEQTVKRAGHDEESYDSEDCETASGSESGPENDEIASRRESSASKDYETVPGSGQVQALLQPAHDGGQGNSHNSSMIHNPQSSATDAVANTNIRGQFNNIYDHRDGQGQHSSLMMYYPQPGTTNMTNTNIQEMFDKVYDAGQEQHNLPVMHHPQTTGATNFQEQFNDAYDGKGQYISHNTPMIHHPSAIDIADILRSLSGYVQHDTGEYRLPSIGPQDLQPGTSTVVHSDCYDAPTSEWQTGASPSTSSWRY